MQKIINTKTRTWLTRLLFLIFSLTGLSGVAIAQSADIDQIRNGSATAPLTPADWVNGNAGPSNAHYAEGYSIPYRMKIAGLVGTSSTIHRLVIEWDTKDQNGHAIDYITHYNNLDNSVGSHATTFGHTPEAVDPRIGTAFTGSPNLYPIPAPSSAGSEVFGQPTASFNALPSATYADVNQMAIWGGTIIGLAYLNEDAPDATTGSTKTRMEISFRSANGRTALIAWGGHIAAEGDWGPGRGATGVSGSPYHTRLISLDGSGGNQDRSLKASAVIIPPPLCGISPAQTACPETPSLTYDATGSSTGSNISYVWTLTNGSTSAGAQISGSNTGFSITVVPIGADFIAGGTFDLSLRVNKVGAESTSCNRATAGTINNVQVAASATPSSFSITSAAHNSQLAAYASLNGGAPTSSVNDNGQFSFNWSVEAPFSLSGLNVLNASSEVVGTLSSTSIHNPVFTATTGGYSVTFGVRATQTAAIGCSQTASVPVSVAAGSGCVNPTGPSPVCEGTRNTYSVSASIQTDEIFTWSIASGDATLVGADANGKVAGVTSVEVDAGTGNFTVRLTKSYSNTSIAPVNCDLLVTVNEDVALTSLSNVSKCPGESASFSSTASGTGASGADIRWYKVLSGVETAITSGVSVSGQSSTLTISSVSAGDAGTYRAKIGGAPLCANDSKDGSLTVNEGVALTSLSNATKCPGESASFSSTASGTGASGADIRWYKVLSGVETAITSGVSVSGQSSTLTISSVSAGDAGTYRAKIGGAPLCANDSKDGSLTVNEGVALTSLSNATKCPGESASFSSTASGTGASGADIRWYKVLSGVETAITSGVSVSGQSSTLTISSVSAGDAGTYRAKIGGAPLCANDSKDGSLTVNDDVALTSLSNVTKCPGESASFSSTASGTGASGADIRWYKVASGVETAITSGVVASGQSSTLTISSVSAGDAGTYRAKIGGAPLCANDSKDGSLTIGNCAHLFPTQTTCCNYLNGNTGNFQQRHICYSVVQGKVGQNANPGVFFYYGDFTTTTTSNVVIVVRETRDNVNKLRYFSAQNASNVRLFSANCGAITPTAIELPTSLDGQFYDVVIRVNSLPAGKYVVSVKYDTKSIVGSPAGGGPDVTYSFSMSVNSNLVPGSSGQLLVTALGSIDCSAITPDGSCASPVTAPVANAQLERESDLKIAAYPNPYTNQIQFNFVAPESGTASLELFDLAGRRIAVLFQGNMDAGSSKSINYLVPASRMIPMIYRLSINDKSVRGRLLPGKN